MELENFSVESLIFPHTATHFVEEYWQRRPFIVHDLNQSIERIQKLPYLASLEALLHSWQGEVQVHLPDVSDESSSVNAAPRDAVKLFESGMALLFNRLNDRYPELASALRGVQHDLGLPKSTDARCMVYATPHGKGSAAHFDQNVNFVLQLHGTKNWWLAPNAHVENPTQRYTIGQPLDFELASYLHQEMPTAMPSDRQLYTLRPGSMLYVPRGYWHCTEAAGDAMALNFTFSQPTYLDLFTAALRSRLLLSPEWRELADGVTSQDFRRRDLAGMKFDALLLELVEDLPNWRSEDILRATEGD